MKTFVATTSKGGAGPGKIYEVPFSRYVLLWRMTNRGRRACPFVWRADWKNRDVLCGTNHRDRRCVALIEAETLKQAREIAHKLGWDFGTV